MRRQATQFFQSMIGVYGDTSEDLAEYRYRSVGFFIGALQTRKTRSFFESDISFARAIDDINYTGVSMLMGAREDIIREVRGMRGGRYTEEYATTLADYAVGMYPGASLNDIVVRLGEVETVDSVAESLAIVIARLEQLVAGGTTPEDTAEQLRLLGVIAGLLG